MFFWLFVTLVALCIGYRKQISARYDRWLANMRREAQYETLLLRFNLNVDTDIIEFFEHITSPKVYMHQLIRVDIGKLARQELIEDTRIWNFCFNDPRQLEYIELKFDRDYNEKEITRLNDAKPNKVAYIKGLLREDIAYRKEHGLLDDTAAV